MSGAPGRVAHAAVGRLAVVGLVMQLAACYSYVPVTTDAPPVVGERYALQISDQGRVGLAERFGPGLSRVEGRLTNVSPQEFAMSVFRVDHFGNQGSTWAGESVRIDRGYIARIESRTLSRRRTVLAVGATTVVLGYFIISRGLLGFYTGDQQEPTPIPPESSIGLTRTAR
ncbi:MAG: hypothetical protein ACT4P7_00195 [Gemmatimonadaceae bacterium]